MAAKLRERGREFTSGSFGRLGFVPQSCSCGMPCPVNVGFVHHQAGMDSGEGRKESGFSMGGLESTFPPALQFIESYNRIIQS